MTKYDFSKPGKQTHLSDGGSATVILLNGTADKTFFEMGEKDFLKGAALDQFLAMGGIVIQEQTANAVKVKERKRREKPMPPVEQEDMESESSFAFGLSL